MPDVSPKISPPPRLRQPTEPGPRREGRLPFLRMVAHLLARLVRGGHETESADFDFGAGPLLGLLAAPGAFCSLMLFEKYSTLQDFILQRRHPVDATQRRGHGSVLRN